MNQESLSVRGLSTRVIERKKQQARSAGEILNWRPTKTDTALAMRMLYCCYSGAGAGKLLQSRPGEVLESRPVATTESVPASAASMLAGKPTAVGYGKETGQPRPVEGNYPRARARELPKSSSAKMSRPAATTTGTGVHPAVGYRKETGQPRPVEGNYPRARARELPKSSSIAADPALAGRMLAWNMDWVAVDGKVPDWTARRPSSGVRRWCVATPASSLAAGALETYAPSLLCVPPQSTPMLRSNVYLRKNCSCEFIDGLQVVKKPLQHPEIFFISLCIAW